jgi:hypothetical protein
MENQGVSDGLKTYYLVPKSVFLDEGVRKFLNDTSHKITRNLEKVNKRSALTIEAAIKKQGDPIGPEIKRPLDISTFPLPTTLLKPTVSTFPVKSVTTPVPGGAELEPSQRAGEKRKWAVDDLLSLAKSARIHGKPGKQTKLIKRRLPYLGLKQALAKKQPPKSRGMQTLPLNPRPFGKKPTTADSSIQLNETDFPAYLLGHHRAMQTDPISPPPEYPTLVDLLLKRHHLDGHALIDHIQSVLDISNDQDEDALLQIVYYLVTEGVEPPPYWMGSFLQTILRSPDFPINRVAAKKRGYLTPEYLGSGINREKMQLRSRLTKKFS